jgi:cobalamin biosynthesis Mg chelatase CobN
MRITTGSVHSSTAVTHNTPAYSPSVPISVYRELAAELQAVQTKLNTLNAQNQHLVQENQLLRQEIAKAVESVLRLQTLLDSQVKVNSPQASPSSTDGTQTKRSVTPAPPKEQPRPRTSSTGAKPSFGSSPEATPTSMPTPVFVPEMEIPTPVPESVFIEEQQISYYPYSEPEPSRIRAWWLVIAILFIIVFGFGAGYLIVRPLFEHHNR